MSKEIRQQVAAAVNAVEEKKGEDLVVLEMDRSSGAFTDYFVVCTGTNPRQIQSISDEVERQLSQLGVRPNSIEGYNQAEWVLVDYVDFVVHIFSTRAREFYGLERLWKSAERLTPADLAKKPAAKKAVKKIAAKRPAAKRASAPASSSTAKRKPSVKKGAKSKPRR
ncbi:MAG TPA: ribosome silencing factor [Candidatus Angelobacter sp.]|nr:ribosome silencing factor [Candidatus Angelobacter sp.]